MAQEVLINTSPRPRILVRGLADRPEVVAAVQELAGTFRRVDSLGEVRHAEWDMLVTDQSLWEFFHLGGPSFVPPVFTDERLSVIYVGQDFVEDGISGVHKCTGEELHRITGLPGRIQALAHEQLEPMAKARGGRHAYFVQKEKPTTERRIEPFLTTADGHVLAGRYKRTSTSECWFLPQDIPDVVPWVKAALAEWHGLAPDRFPGLPDWAQTRAWMTGPEREANRRLEQLYGEREELLRDLANREAELTAQLREHREAGNAYQRALLTEQSAPLEQAVGKALEQLGFTVTDMDATAKPDERLEDFRIEDPNAPGWLALVEVKGYTGGAKTEGIVQLMRFGKRYLQETKGTAPSASWYIVNQFLKRDPSTRQPAFHGSSGEVESFAADNGLIVDTVNLFQLLADVEGRTLSREEARRLLCGSTGLFRHPKSE